jgi:hypothetical protein
LLAAYDDEAVSGVGGRVLDRSGWWQQYGYTVSERLGYVRSADDPPTPEQAVPGADPFVFLQGCNMSFRRADLVELDGFDEALALFQDDVDICVRLIDAGKLLRPLSTAVVHHDFLPNASRRTDGLAGDPLERMTAFAYFACRHGSPSKPSEQVDGAIERFAESLQRVADATMRTGEMTAALHARFCARVLEGLRRGRALATAGRSACNAIPAPDPDAFRRFETHARPPVPLRICILAGTACRAHPERLLELETHARTLAELGHDVHVITCAEGLRRVEFDRSLWRHEFDVRDRAAGDLGDPVRGELAEMAAMHHEVIHINERAPVDLVLAPLEECSAMVCALDMSLPAVILLDGRRSASNKPNSRLGSNARLASCTSLAFEDAQECAARNPGLLGDSYPDVIAVLGGRAVFVTSDTTRRHAEPNQSLAEILAEALVQTFDLTPTIAQPLATDMLDRSTCPTDFRARAISAWQEDDTSFVRTMYQLLLDREIDAFDLENWLAHLAAGGPRVDFARALIDSQEAPARRAPLTLPDDVLAALRARQPQAAAASSLER